MKLIKEMFPADELLTAEQVRLLMLEHAKRSGSGRKAAKSAGVSSAYWYRAAMGLQPIGDLIAKSYRLRHVDMWELVEEE